MDGGLPTTASLTVPPRGGVLEVCTLSGGLLQLTLPSSAAGITITASALSPRGLSWTNPSFVDALRDAVRLEPAALTFDDPVRVRLPFGTQLGFVFTDRTTVPWPLRKSADRNTLELRSLGTLGVLGPTSCIAAPGAAPTSAWRDTPGSGMCSGFIAQDLRTYREYNCHGTAFCADVSFGCCVQAGKPGVECTDDDPTWFMDYVRANSEPSYPYCDGPGDTAHVNSCDQTLVANYLDQEITLRGTNFSPHGHVIGLFGAYGAGSFVNSSHWISATEVRAVVRGFELNSVGTAYLGYHNPAPGSLIAEPSWRSNGLPVAVAAPAVVCPVPLEGTPPAGACSSSPGGCECSVTFDSGDGMHMYRLACTGSDCACTRDGVVLATLNSSNGGSYVCNGGSSNVVATWKQVCRPSPGFCP